MAASGPGITDIKLLFARSGNVCAFPRCKSPLALDETLVGEVCHIKGARPGSARFDPSQTDLERNTYSNLILMCPTHHTVIDDDEEAYPAERLCNIKTAHEARSTPIPEHRAAAVAEHYQSINNIGQIGGLSAHTVNASTITFQSSTTGGLTQQRQIQAVERLWQVVRSLSSEFSLVIFIDTLFTTDELDGHFKRREHAQILDCIKEYADLNVPIRKLATAGANDAAKERPFVSHRLWSIFYVLHAIYGRSALLLTNSYKERKYIDWRADNGCDQLLRAVLPAHTVERAKTGGLRTAIEDMEGQFLAEAGMNKPYP